MLRNVIGTPKSLNFDKGAKNGELVVVNTTGAEEIIRINNWRSVHYLFEYCDKSIDKKNYVKDIINPFLAHAKEDQIAQSKSHFGKRDAKERQFIFRVEEDGFLWCFMTTAWKPLTIDAVHGLLPATAWEMTSVVPTDRHGGMITYNMMFPDSVTAIVTIDAGMLDGMSAMSIKGKLFGELGEIHIDEKRKYRHTDVSKIGSGLIETFESMNRLHDMLPNIINIPFNIDMLGEFKGKLGKELTGKLTGILTVYHAVAILRDAGKKNIAGTVLINSSKGTAVASPTPVVIPTPEPAGVLTNVTQEEGPNATVVEATEPQITITPVQE